MFPLSRRVIALGGKPWTPKSAAGLALWLRADDLTGADGSAVASWTSREGSTYAFAQGTGSNQPTVKTGANGINGHNVVLFDGGDVLIYTGTISTATSGTLLAVCRLTDPVQNNETFLSSADTATGNYFLGFRAYWWSTVTYPCITQRNNDVEDRISASTTAILSNTVYLYNFNSSGTAYSMRVNGANQGLTVESGGNNGDWFGDIQDRDVVALGNLQTSTQSGWYKGSIAEILLYNTPLSTSDRTKAESYLAARYGVTLA